MTIKATNDNAWICRDIPASETSGILIPDSAKPAMHRGKIMTVGKLVSDPDIKEGRTAIFNKSAGFPIVEDGVEYTILKQMDIIGTDL